MGAVQQGGAWNISTSKQGGVDLEVLKHHVNADYSVPIVLDASAATADTDGVLRWKAGTLLTKNVNNQYQRYTAGSAVGGTAEVQTVTITGTPTGGQFRLAYGTGDQTQTDEIERNAPAATVQAELLEIPTIPAGTTVTGSAGGPYTVTFPASAGNVQALTVTNDFTGGTSPTAAVATTTPGVQSATLQVIAGVLAVTQEFPDNLAHSDAPSSMWNHGQVFRSDRIVDWVSYGAAARTALPTCRFD